VTESATAALRAARDAHSTRDLCLLLLAGVIVVGAGLGLRDPWAPDEPRYVLIARDMHASGQWLFPSRGGEIYADKPPLYFWMLAIALGATGSIRAAFLVPSLVASLVTLGLVYDIARRLWDARTGLAAGLLLLVTIQFTQHAKAAHIDATLCLWTTLSLYALLRHVLLGPAWGWYTTAWLVAGIGIMTKGVGFLALLALIPYAFARVRDWPDVVRGGGWRWFVCAAALLLPLVAWLGPMLYAVDASQAPDLVAYRDNILFRQTVERYANAWGHRQPWWYFLVGVIPWFWLPVTALLPWLVPAWWNDLRARDARTLLLLGLVAAIVIFFSLSTGKRGVYVLPAVPPLALAAAPHLSALLARRSVQRAGFVLTALMAALLLAVAAWLAVGGQERIDALSVDYGLSPVVVAVVFGAVAALWLATGPRRGALAFAGMLASYWIVGGVWLYPALNPVRSAATLMRTVEGALAPGEELAIVRYREQFLLQATRPVTHFGYRRADTDDELRDALAWLMAAPGRRLLVDDERLHQCFRPDGPRLMAFASDQQWYLARAEDSNGACDSGGSAFDAIVYDGARK
jgi:4-amino-4-deoxy-L-arabinose transferase-like glycosyltransferase